LDLVVEVMKLYLSFVHKKALTPVFMALTFSMMASLLPMGRLDSVVILMFTAPVSIGGISS